VDNDRVASVHRDVEDYAWPKDGQREEK
jgi:hypothetical protein